MGSEFTVYDFLSFQNPIIIALTVTFFIVLVIIISYKVIYNPLLKKHSREKRFLKKKNDEISKSLILADPNPIIRIDKSLNILLSNPSAIEVLDSYNFENRMRDVILKFKTPLEEIINLGLTETARLNDNSKIFDVTISGVKSLKAAQLYYKDVTEDIRKEQEISDYRKRVRKASVKQDLEIEKERKRISKELHDSLAHKLVIASKNLENTDENRILKSVTTLKSLVNESLQEARSISHNLRPIDIENQSLIESLQTLFIRLKSVSNITPEFTYNDIPNDLDYEIKINVHRIVQESINNILKHADADNFSVDILYSKNNLSILITDDGKGFMVKRLSNGQLDSLGLGIISIQERIQFMNGYFDIDSEPGQGTTLSIEIPIGEKGE